MSKATERYFNSLNLPRGKTIVITGGNSGIGLEVATYLSRLNWHIVLAVRNRSRGQEAKRKLLTDCPELSVEVRALDLSNRESIEAFCRDLIADGIDVDVFYANAGIYRVPFARCYGGLESHMAVNCAANYLIYENLKDYFLSLGHPVKFVLTSSIVARFGKINEGDLFGEKDYDANHAYRKSKVGVNQLFTYLCGETHSASILPMLVHPGVVHTPLIDKAFHGFPKIAAKIMRAGCHKVDKAALSTVYVLQDKIDRPVFCGPRGIGHIYGYPKIYRLHSKNLENYPKTIAQLHAILFPDR